MCGIFCVVSTPFGDTQCKCKDLEEKIKPLLCRRGPNYYGQRKVDIWLPNEDNDDELFQQDCGGISVRLSASVLHLRGNVIAKQPVQDDDGNILAWNGEIFSGLKIKESDSDTAVLLSNLRYASPEDATKQIFNTLGVIEGPWSIVYYQAYQQCIWFGRDYFGRRSLLWHRPTSSSDFFALSSVGMRESEHTVNNFWEEVPADGIYCVDLKKLGQCLLGDESQDLSVAFTKYAWQRFVTEVADSKLSYGPKCPVENIFNKELPVSSSPSLILRECFDTEQQPSQNEEAPSTSLNLSTKHINTDDSNMAAPKVCYPGTSGKKSNGHLTYSSTRHNYRGIVATGDTQTVQSKESCNSDEDKGSDCGNSNTDKPSTHHHLVNRAHTDSCDEVFVRSLSSGDNSYVAQGNTFCTHSKEHSERTDLFPSCCESVQLNDTCFSRTRCDKAPTDDISRQASNLDKTVDLLSLNEQNITQRWIEQFVDILTEAIRRRVFNLPREALMGTVGSKSCEDKTSLTSEYSKNEQSDKMSKVGILFSGGLDSIVLAALADRCVPPEESIDLINVAFEQNVNQNKCNKGKHKHQNCKAEMPIKNFDVPDRVTGRNGVAELNELNPNRLWNFVEVNVTLEELQDARSQIITHLVFPQSTVLDDSIGCAIWFAARGTGQLIRPECLHLTENVESLCHHTWSYTSPAKYITLFSIPNIDVKTAGKDISICSGVPMAFWLKVLLVGMGADEQLGGYARHRSRFIKEGWQGLLEEMEMEVQRISKRNLGRDDRCISDHGREGRYPYLDENVVSFLNTLPVWVKCDPRLDRGVGEKILLRQAAKFIGLTRSSDLPKRAIQFGSKIAKLEKSREKGDEICNRL